MTAALADWRGTSDTWRGMETEHHHCLDDNNDPSTKDLPINSQLSILKEICRKYGDNSHINNFEPE